ncbi:phage tail protein [Streptomyces sp. IMTB 2501]|uniref:phage tail protein n=1 Tax=Streptomyces sp. IMTB 2501 TaxID=1776340 RepID=UPI00096F654D|nr:phage tail protein [Streptomyces sp. IMTB 2501]OLZ71977.1 phage tail protein [Streptomyces sp. IMTB 2501]
MTQAGKRVDPFTFTLEIDGLSGSHGFSECSGANTEQDVIEYREGNMDSSVIKLPGLKKFGDITLKRGFTTNRELWDWRRNVLEGTVTRRSGRITFNDEAGKPTVRWKFTNAWPKQYTAPSLSGTSTEVAVEELVLVVETFELDAE